MPDAPNGLADTLAQQKQELADSLFAQATVISSNSRSVTVSMFGTTQTWPYIKSYHPAVNDVVLMAGAPGSWICLGSMTTTNGFVRVNGLDSSPTGITAAGVGVGSGGLLVNGITTLRDDLNADGGIQCAGLSCGPIGITASGIHAQGGGIVSDAQTLTNGLRVEPAGAYVAGLTVGSGGAVVFGSLVMSGGGISTNGISCGPVGGTFSGLTVQGGGIVSSGQILTNGLRVEPTGAYIAGLTIGGGGGVNFGGWTGAPSLRRYKKDITPAAGALADVKAARVQHFRYTDEALEEFGEDAAPACAGWRRGVMADDLPEDCVKESVVGVAPETESMLFRAWGAIGELADIVDRQAAQIVALEDRLAALEAAAS